MVATGVCDLVSGGDGLIAALASSLRELSLQPPLARHRAAADVLGSHTFAKTFKIIAKGPAPEFRRPGVLMTTARLSRSKR